jgi:hypothetical protein
MTTKTIEIQMSFDELMDIIENHLVYAGYVKENEFLMYADLGLPIDERGNVAFDIEVDEFPVEEEPADLFDLHGTIDTTAQ